MNLKKYKFTCILLLVVLAFTGCYKDKSNEALIPINEIGIQDPKSKSVITIFPGQILNLKPELTLSMQEKIDKLDFSWTLYNNNENISVVQPRAVIADVYELNYPITPDIFTLGEPYVLRFKVTDKDSGVSSYLTYNITIGNKYQNGWLVLEEKAGTGDLSFVFSDNTVEHEVYSSRNTAILANPKKLEIATYSISDDMSPPGKRLYILAEGGSQEFNYLTLVKKFDYRHLFFLAPSIQKPQLVTWVSKVAIPAKPANLGLIVNNGKAHTNLVGGFPGIKKWGEAALNPSGNLNYSLAPYAVGGPNVDGMFYDNTSKRFYSVIAFSNTPGAGSLTAFPPTASTGAFDLNNVGMEMLFLDSADQVNQYNAIMKSADNKPYLLRFKTVNTSTATPNLTIDKKEMDAPGVLNYSAAAGSTNTGHIYYGNANVLSAYVTGSNRVVENYSFPAGENITAIKYAKYQYQDTNPIKLARLVVATWNGTEGKLYYFTISQLGEIGAYTNQFTGFSKIVDLAYKF